MKRNPCTYAHTLYKYFRFIFSHKELFNKTVYFKYTFKLYTKPSHVYFTFIFVFPISTLLTVGNVEHVALRAISPSWISWRQETCWTSWARWTTAARASRLPATASTAWRGPRPPPRPPTTSTSRRSPCPRTRWRPSTRTGRRRTTTTWVRATERAVCFAEGTVYRYEWHWCKSQFVLKVTVSKTKQEREREGQES